MIPEEVKAALHRAKSVVVLTGAGMSAESGVPTFREASSGLWAKYDPMTLATPEAFAKDPLLVWNWYLHRRRQMDQTQPNAGHYAVAALERIVPKLVVVTQNVDGLHSRAGSTEVLELHGSLYKTKRFQDGEPVAYPWPENLENFEFTQETLPRCVATGDLLRPDIVWFGEALNTAIIDKAFSAVRSCDLAIVIGTSGVVYPAAHLPVEALQSGSYVIEINPQPTPFSPRVHAYFEHASGQIMPELVQVLEEHEK